MVSPVSSSNSVGIGPVPTRVLYALNTPVIWVICLGLIPMPTDAPPIVGFDEVTKG